MEKQRLVVLDLETEINVAKCKMTIMKDTFSALLDKPVTHDIGLQDYLTEDGVAGLCFVFNDVVNLLNKIEQFVSYSPESAEITAQLAIIAAHGNALSRDQQLEMAAAAIRKVKLQMEGDGKETELS